MRKILVTLETDGLRDYVRFPNGHRKILGTISVLKFVTKVAPKREVRGALDAFNAFGSCVITADIDIMEELMAPTRTRWAAKPLLVSPLIDEGNRISAKAEGSITMSQKTLLERLGQLEQTVTRLDKYAKDEGLIAPKLHEGLRSLAAGLHFYNPGDQSKNDAWYIDSAPKVDTVEGNQSLPSSATHASALGTKVEVADVSTTPVFAPKPSTTPVMAPEPSTTPVYAPGTKSASTQSPSYEILKANTELAQGILDTVESTNTKVEALVTAGRKFNAAKAQGDLYAIASRTSEILNSVDLAQSWVRKDLTALDDSAKQIHNLFASAKV
jgi:hypothetical protein